MDQLTSHPTSTPLFGRGKVLDTLTGAGDGLTILAGDSGVGKSAVLSSLAEAQTTRVCVPPTRIRGYTGSLMRGLLEQAAHLVAQHVTPRTGAKRVVELVRSASAKVAGTTVEATLKLLGAHFVSMVRARWGEEIADVLEDVVDTAGSDAGTSLAAKINERSAQDEVAALCAILSEAASLTESPILLLLDSGPTLSDLDNELLRDLPSLIPDGVVVVLALTVGNLAQTKRLKALEAAGARIVKLTPLTDKATAKWLRHVGLAHIDVRAVHTQTGGYPLFIQAAIPHLLSGKEIDAVPGGRAFAAATELALDALPRATADAALTLSLFATPLSDEAAMQITGASETRWSLVQRELVESTIFSVLIDGAPWFHDRKRSVVQQTLLPSLRRTVATRIATFFFENPRMLRFENLADFVGLCSAADKRDAPDLLIQVSSLPRETVAVYGALLELSEKEGESHGAVLTHHVLQHAGLLLGSAAAQPESLRPLLDLDLIYVAANDHASACVPMVRSESVAALLFGRCMVEFGHPPLRGIASAVAQALVIPILGKFETLQYGVGDPRISELPGQMEEAAKSGVTSRSPQLIAQLRLGERPLYFHAVFNKESARDRSAKRLGKMPATVFGLPLSVERRMVAPTPCLPSMRFVRAWNIASGNRIDVNSFSPPKLESPILLAEAAKRLCASRRVIRARVSETWRAAAGVQHAESIAFAEVAGGYFIGRVTSERQQEIQFDWPPDMVERDPYFDINLGARLGLLAGEHLHAWTRGSRWDGLSDLTAEEIAKTAKNCSQFNRRFGLPLAFADLGALELAARDATREAYEDARALFSVGAVNIPLERLSPRKWTAMIHGDVASSDNFRSRLGSCVVTSSPADEVDVEILLLSAAEVRERVDALWRGNQSFSQTFALEGLAELLSTDARSLDRLCIDNIVGTNG